MNKQIENALESIASDGEIENLLGSVLDNLENEKGGAADSLRAAFDRCSKHFDPEDMFGVSELQNFLLSLLSEED